MTDNEKSKICPTPQFCQDSKGIGAPTVTLGEVPDMENTPSSNLLFLEWTKQVCRENRGILEYMLKSSDQLDRVIAKRIIQNASGGIN